MIGIISSHFSWVYGLIAPRRQRKFDRISIRQLVQVNLDTPLSGHIDNWNELLIIAGIVLDSLALILTGDVAEKHMRLDLFHLFSYAVFGTGVTQSTQFPRYSTHGGTFANAVRIGHSPRFLHRKLRIPFAGPNRNDADIVGLDDPCYDRTKQSWAFL